jgi:hypothetical protein
MTFEVRHWATNYEDQIGVNHKGDSGSIGNIFYGSNGYLCVEWYTKYWTYLFDTKTKERHAGPAEDEGGNNWANFIDAVRAKDPAKRNAPIEEGAKSATLMHLANISYRLGRTLTFDADKMECVGDHEANAMFKRKYRAPYVVPDAV